MDGPSYRLAFPSLTPMVRRLLIATAAVFGVQYALSFAAPWDAWVTRILGLDPLVWRRFFPFVPFWQLVTYGFLHSTGELRHLLYNLLLLYFFGTMLEERLGGRRFVVTYLAAMVAGGALHLLLELVFGPGPPAIGASGAVLGITIACAVLMPDAQVILLFVPVKLKWVALALVAIDVFGVLEQMKHAGWDPTAHYVHLGGALYGFLAARKGWLWKDPISRLEARRAIAREERRVSDEERMDELLAKIHREGLNALSRGEKEFLRRMSQRR